MLQIDALARRCRTRLAEVVLMLFLIPVAACSILSDDSDADDCRAVDAPREKIIREEWPSEFGKVEYFGGGECDNSGDERIYTNNVTTGLTNEEASQILRKDGWQLNPKNKVWEREAQGSQLRMYVTVSDSNPPQVPKSRREKVDVGMALEY